MAYQITPWRIKLTWLGGEGAQDRQEVGRQQPTCGMAPSCASVEGLPSGNEKDISYEDSSASAKVFTQTQVDPVLSRSQDPVLSRSLSPAHGQKVSTASGNGKVFYKAAVKAVLEDKDLQRVGPQDEEISLMLDKTQTENRVRMLGREAFGGLLRAAINLSPAGGQVPEGFQNGSPLRGLEGQILSPGGVWSSTPEGDGWASTPEK